MHKHPGSRFGHGFPYSNVRLSELLCLHAETGTGEFIRRERNCSYDGPTPEAMMFRGVLTNHIACAYKHPTLKHAREARKPKGVVTLNRFMFISQAWSSNADCLASAERKSWNASAVLTATKRAPR